MADHRSQRAAFYTEHLGDPLRILPAKRGEDPPVEVFVFAPNDAKGERVAEIVRPFGAIMAEKYHRLVIEDLI